MIILSASAARFADLLRQRHDSLVEAWVSRVRAQPIYRERPVPEIFASASEVLRAVERWVVTRDTNVLETAALALARRREAGQFPHSEVVDALLAGRETITESCRKELASEDAIAAVSLLDTAFDRLVSRFSTSFCQLCRERQDDRRVHVERQLESVVERSLDAMIFVDEIGRILTWNPGAERLFGWAADDVVGDSMDRLIPVERRGREGVAVLLEEIRQSGYVRVAETQRVHAEGHLVWVDAAFTTVRDRTGEVAGAWGVFRDVGERKRLEEENLQAERLALIGTMSAKLAHEVRNPLGSLVLGLDLIRDNLRALESKGGEAVRETQDLVTSIESEMQRIRAVVEHYLQFARLPVLRVKPVALDEALRAHLELVRGELEARHVRLDLHLGARAGLVSADEAQLWQAILNLVGNAADAMPDGGTVTVTTRLNENEWECEVADTGCGIGEEARAKMFVPFYSTKRSGTGLGLPLTQQIVNEHGGTLACHSVPGKGTRFVIRLPRGTTRATSRTS